MKKEEMCKSCLASSSIVLGSVTSVFYFRYWKTKKAFDAVIGTAVLSLAVANAVISFGKLYPKDAERPTKCD